MHAVENAETNDQERVTPKQDAERFAQHRPPGVWFGIAALDRRLALIPWKEFFTRAFPDQDGGECGDREQAGGCDHRNRKALILKEIPNQCRAASHAHRLSAQHESIDLSEFILGSQVDDHRVQRHVLNGRHGRQDRAKNDDRRQLTR